MKDVFFFVHLRFYKIDSGKGCQGHTYSPFL